MFIFQTKQKSVYLPNQTHPYQTEINHTKPNSSIPNRTQSHQTKLIHTKPNSIIPNQTHPYQTELNHTKPKSSIPNWTQPYQTKLIQTIPKSTTPDQTHSYQTELNHTKPNSSKPNYIQLLLITCYSVHSCNKKNCGRHTGPVLHHRQVVFTCCWYFDMTRQGKTTRQKQTDS